MWRVGFTAFAGSAVFVVHLMLVGRVEPDTPKDEGNGQAAAHEVIPHFLSVFVTTMIGGDVQTVTSDSWSDHQGRDPDAIHAKGVLARRVRGTCLRQGREQEQQGGQRDGTHWVLQMKSMIQVS